MAYGLQNQKVGQSVRSFSCQASSEELKSVWFEAKRNLLQGSDWAMVSCSPAAVSNTLGIVFNKNICSTRADPLQRVSEGEPWQGVIDEGGEKGKCGAH